MIQLRHRGNGLRSLVMAVVLTITMAMPVSAQISVSNLTLQWEDSLAVVQPEIMNPFTAETKQTLESGMPVAVDIEAQFIRTGYVKHMFKRVIVQYNVWTDRYRVVTPIGPLSMADYETVINLFRNDLIITISEDELDATSEWFVKVRAGERRVLREEDTRSDALSRIEDDLPGIAGWLFRRGRPKETFCEWSALKKLDRSSHSGAGR